jgi:hypothetical protein
MKSNTIKKIILSVFSLAVLLTASSWAEPVIALTSGNRLLFFDSATPGTVTKLITVNTVGNETLLAMDFRPATGDLYAFGPSGRLYILNLTSGLALTPVGTAAPLSGTRFGFDFNPTVDRIRVVTNTNQNVRLHPDTGATANTDTTLAFAATDINSGANPNVVAAAYTNNFAGAGATVLYDIDSALNALLVQSNPNGGILNTVGPLGFDTTDNIGFDISAATGVAFASLTPTVGVTAGLYTINLGSGAATLVGTIANATILAGETVTDIALPTSMRLLNISTRGRVGLGDDVLIGAFISRGGGRVLIRALGPSLAAFGVPGPLADPVVTLRDQNGAALLSNDDWRSSQEGDITATGLAPGDNAEPAILASLPGGNYSAVVTGKGTAEGVALVEVFQLD